VPAFRVKLGANDLNYVDAVVKPYSLTHFVFVADGLQTLGYKTFGQQIFLDDYLDDTGWKFRRQQLDVWAAMNICAGKGFSSSDSISNTL